jgi:hypothetical protein
MPEDDEVIFDVIHSEKNLVHDLCPWTTLCFAGSNRSSISNILGESQCAAAGQKIQVVEITSKKHSGLFASVSDTAISYRETTGEQSIQKRDVLSVILMENKHRLRNSLIVAGASAGVGAAIGAAVYKPCSTSFCLDVGGRALPTGIGAVFGGVGGAVVGVLLPSHSTIYSVSSH